MNRKLVCAVMVLFFLIIVITMISCSDGGGGSQPVIISGPRIGMVTTNEAVINWDTQVPTQGVVIYRLAGDSAFTGRALSTTGTDRQSATITNLKPNTTYEFMVEGDPTVRSFKTSTTDNVSFVFITMADNRGQSDTADLVALPQAFRDIITNAATRNAVFAVNAGDIFYGKNPNITTFKQLYQNFKTAIQPLARLIPYYISPGNHEMSPLATPEDKAGFDPIKLFKEEFPQPAQLDGYEGTVFSWDHGKVHFVSIATNQFDASQTALPKHHMYYVSDAQISWLDKDLKKAKADGAQFIFVFGHANAFDDPSWKLDPGVGDLQITDKDQRDKFWKVLSTNKVDAYVCGHQHFFNNSTHDGVVQWLNGNSGSVDPTKGKNQYTVWTVDSTTNTVTGELFDEQGNKDPDPASTITFKK